MIGQFCALDAGEQLMQGAFDRMGLTARSHDRILRMARTIADLEGSERIEAPHLAEAIQYRSSSIALLSRSQRQRTPPGTTVYKIISWKKPSTMHEIILCKLGEVVLKGLNRRSFERS